MKFLRLSLKLDSELDLELMIYVNKKVADAVKAHMV